MRLFFNNMYTGTPDITTLALVTLYPLNMGAIGLLVGVLHLLFVKQGRTRTPWSDYKHIASDSVGALILGVGFLTSAFIPTTMTFGELLPIGLPAQLATLPARFGIWIPIILVGAVVYIAVEIILRRMQPPQQPTEPPPHDEKGTEIGS